jgi:tRNA pseudouridine13 synthase
VRFRQTGQNTADAVRNLARALGVDPGSAGFAGLKDRHAVTSQWASFFGADEARALEVAVPGLEVLEAKRHPHKLRTGHLKANRFRILLRDAPVDAANTAHALLSELSERGAPNFYGEQRFGHAGENIARAERWLLEGGRAPKSRFERKLLVSVWQARWFNVYLARRMRARGLHQALRGDLMRREDSGGMFTADDVAEAQARLERFELSATGPILGEDMRWPTHDALELERALLAETGITPERLRELRKLAPGSRRVLRIRPACVSVEPTPIGLWLGFELPKGAYATVILRELLKPEGDEAAEQDDDESEIAGSEG